MALNFYLPPLAAMFYKTDLRLPDQIFCLVIIIECLGWYDCLIIGWSTIPLLEHSWVDVITLCTREGFLSYESPQCFVSPKSLLKSLTAQGRFLAAHLSNTSWEFPTSKTTQGRFLVVYLKYHKLGIPNNRGFGEGALHWGLGLPPMISSFFSGIDRRMTQPSFLWYYVAFNR